MKKELSPRAFLLRLAAFGAAILLFFGGVMFLVDPYFQYRLPEADYVLTDRFCTENMIEKYDYDAVLVGSSMCQNFEMDELDAACGGEVLKAVKGGLNPAEALTLLRKISSVGRADTVYLSLDITTFAKGEKDTYYPEYLTNDTALDDWRYLYGYEAWMRYLPMDVLLLGLNAIDRPVPAAFADEVDPDLIGTWGHRATYYDADTLVQRYLAGEGTVSAQNPEGLYEQLCAQLDLWLEQKPFAEDVTYHVFLCPYSALSWAHFAREGSMDAILAFRNYYCETLGEYDNVILYDFQGIDETRDLTLYKDISHYHPSLNSLMATAFANGTHRVSEESLVATEKAIRDGVWELQKKYPELIPRT